MLISQITEFHLKNLKISFSTKNRVGIVVGFIARNLATDMGKQEVFIFNSKFFL